MPAACSPGRSRPTNGALVESDEPAEAQFGGEYFCESMLAFRLLWKSTSMSSSPASTRATSSASMPAGWIWNARPALMSASQTSIARSHGIQIS